MQGRTGICRIIAAKPPLPSVATAERGERSPMKPGGLIQLEKENARLRKLQAEAELDLAELRSEMRASCSGGLRGCFPWPHESAELGAAERAGFTVPGRPTIAECFR